MNGINASTGKALGGIEHLRQSIRDILTTPIGSRVMLRDYGCRISQLIDAPMNRATIMDVYAAAAEALDRWEPRFRLDSMQAVSADPGRLVLDLVGTYLPDGREIKIDGIIIQ